MRRACQFVLLGIVSLLGETGAHGQVSFYTAVDLALRNSTPVRINAADVQHAEAAVMQTIDAYKPSFSVGSSLGYSYGFPVGQPSIYSVAANSLAPHPGVPATTSATSGSSSATASNARTRSGRFLRGSSVPVTSTYGASMP